MAEDQPINWPVLSQRAAEMSGGQTAEMSIPFRYQGAMTRCVSTDCHKRVERGDEAVMVALRGRPDEPAMLHIACARLHGYPIYGPTTTAPHGPTPWREALDGKLAILGALATTASRRSLLAFFLDNPSVAALPTQQERLAMANRHVETTIRQLGDMVRQLEPFHVSPEIRRALMTTVVSETDRALALASPVVGLEAFAFTTDTIPTPEGGLIWLPPDPTARPKEDGRLSFHENVRAILFVPAWVGTPLADGRFQVDDPRKKLSIISFVDAVAAGWDWAEGGRLVPFCQPPTPYGATVIEMVARVQDGYPDDATDRAYHGYPFLLLGALFGWMQGRILKQGRAEAGPGDRATRRRAERVDVMPTVRVVEWRKAAYAQQHGDGHRSVDWSCQWPVVGHIRTLADGRKIHIPPYVKGPRGKPFRRPADRVNVIDR